MVCLTYRSNSSRTTCPPCCQSPSPHSQKEAVCSTRTFKDDTDLLKEDSVFFQHLVECREKDFELLGANFSIEFTLFAIEALGFTRVEADRVFFRAIKSIPACESVWLEYGTYRTKKAHDAAMRRPAPDDFFFEMLKNRIVKFIGIRETVRDELVKLRANVVDSGHAKLLDRRSFPSLIQNLDVAIQDLRSMVAEMIRIRGSLVALSAHEEADATASELVGEWE
ncbi:hypothetical protein BJ508DRAFT_324557 [Ascobolus immersus RN42]|uniref:Uncharacterized protein n=1 Tax=Ascobolus immersus RN42 TaxID=1160509 RepID=A0A3N4IBS5_ASCIM|nr:hypothetical protein BJ508DRAFT_324557 [Ascobolus immersus RN42]